MHEIDVEVVFPASRERVFAAIADHERLLSPPVVDRCVVTRPGRDTRDGLGAIREVDTGGLHFVEEIVRFEPPRRLDYVVRRVTVGPLPFPMAHELGWLELEPVDGGTRVRWRSRFRMTVPVVGGLLGRTFVRTAGAAFRRMLEQARARLS